MSSYNKCVMMGHLGRDPELRKTQSGKSVAKASLAVNERRKGGEDDYTMWIDLVAFDRTAEILAQYCKKGSNVLVEGRMHWARWEGKDGSKHSKHEIYVDRLVLLGKSSEERETTTADDYGDLPI